MNVLVINCGSSSLKFQLINSDTEAVLAKGLCERIAIDGKLTHKNLVNDKVLVSEIPMPSHVEATRAMIDAIIDNEYGVLKSMSEISAIGHRVVNAGENHFDSVLIDDAVLEDIRCNVDFAPLHIPGSIAGIESAMSLCPGKPNVAVFDIGFHKSIPEHVYRYAIPKRYYDTYRIRRYGAHGTSHYYVTQRCADLLGKKPEDINMVSCHIGSGASITAVKNGKSFDTSMGFTPLEGIMMNTRSGDIDPAVVEFICNKEGKTVSEVIKMLNKESGLLGAIGTGMADMRDITENLSDPNVKMAFDMYCHRIKKYICSYMGILGGADAIVFTAGCGEHTPELREAVTKDLEFMGVKLDNEKNWNAPRGEEVLISAKDSKVKIFVIPTDEEMVIAEETLKTINNL